MNKDINSTELKQVKVREVSIEALLVDASSPGWLVLRTRVYGNKCDILHHNQYELFDVRIRRGSQDDYLEFRNSMIEQHAIWARVPVVDEFNEEPELMNRAWISHLIENIGEYKEALRLENPEAYESEMNQGFTGGKAC